MRGFSSKYQALFITSLLCTALTIEFDLELATLNPGSRE